MRERCGRKFQEMARERKVFERVSDGEGEKCGREFLTMAQKREDYCGPSQSNSIGVDKPLQRLSLCSSCAILLHRYPFYCLLFAVLFSFLSPLLCL